MLRVAREHAAGRVPLVYGRAATTRPRWSAPSKAPISAATTPCSRPALPTTSPARPASSPTTSAWPTPARCPVILYNVPGRTSSNLTADTTLRLAQHPNIIGIKEASGNMEQCMAIAAGKPTDFLLISGDDMLTTCPHLPAGARASSRCWPTPSPAASADMTRAALAGEFAAARQLLFGLRPSTRSCMRKATPWA